MNRICFVSKQEEAQRLGLNTGPECQGMFNTPGKSLPVAISRIF